MIMQIMPQSTAFADQPEPAVRKKKKFNASLPFSPFTPYAELFGERVPLVQCLELAVGNYLRQAFISQLRRPFTAVECGVYTGSSLVATAKILQRHHLRYKLYGLDTFSGLPPLSDKDKVFAPTDAPYREQTFFTDTSLESVTSKVKDAGLSKQVTLLPGLFTDTLPQLKPDRFHFVNIDCDLYEPHLECLNYFYPRLLKGGVIFFDDYHSVEYPMAAKAIDDFLADKPERLFHLRFGDDAPNRTKSFIVKY